MSGEPKTHTPEPMTLEEALRAVHFERLPELRERHGYLADVQMEITEDGWWVFLNNDGKSKNQIKEFTRWEDAASFALGVRVVARDEANDDLTTAYMAGFEKGRDAARDEAAELRAENERMRKALAAVDSFLSHEYHRNGHRLTGKEWAADVLRQVEVITRRRLAGGESER